MNRTKNIMLMCFCLITAIIVSPIQKWQAASYEITVKVSDNLMGTAQKIERDGIVALEAVPFLDYEFQGWYCENSKVSDSSSYSFIPDKNAEYIAELSFKENYLIGDTNSDENKDVCDLM